MSANRASAQSEAPLPRGRGLLAIGLVVAAWGIMRVALWESPLLPEILPPLAASDASGREAMPAPSETQPLTEWVVPVPVHWESDRVIAPLRPALAPPDWRSPATPNATRGPVLQREAYGSNRVLGHANLLRMGFGMRPSAAAVPSPVLAPRRAGLAIYDAPAAARELRATPAPPRWSLDAWVLWREGGNAPLVAGLPSYGRSQAGAVLRYALAEASGHRPQLYLRATSALEGARERDIAFGASAHPLPAFPLRLAAETRLSETASGTEWRAAGYAVTELPPLALPGGLTGEAYAQAGYVTGNAATPFVDGQARITRPVLRRDDFRLEAGAGAWGGAQDDAQRLDIGPSAALTFRLGETQGRLSADYRFRVAGDAEPESGPAITLSAGF